MFHRFSFCVTAVLVWFKICLTIESYIFHELSLLNFSYFNVYISKYFFLCAIHLYILLPQKPLHGPIDFLHVWLYLWDASSNKHQSPKNAWWRVAELTFYWFSWYSHLGVRIKIFYGCCDIDFYYLRWKLIYWFDAVVNCTKNMLMYFGRSPIECDTYFSYLKHLLHNSSPRTVWKY